MIIDNKSKATYKIEVHFGKDRTTSGPNLGALSVYQSGNRLDGEGDELMYICAERDKGLALNAPGIKDAEVKKGRGGCGCFIKGSLLKRGLAACPGCESIVVAENLTSVVLFNLTTEALAEKLVVWFNKLEHDADIYLKYHPTDIRYTALTAAHGLDKGRMLRGLTIYPLKNIVKDTSSGSSLKSRFIALLSS